MGNDDFGVSVSLYRDGSFDTQGLWFFILNKQFVFNPERNKEFVPFVDRFFTCVVRTNSFPALSAEQTISFKDILPTVSNGPPLRKPRNVMSPKLVAMDVCVWGGGS